MTIEMQTGWWRPDPANPTKGPDWPPVDLEKSGLSDAILIRSDGSMRRLLHPGRMVLAFTDRRTPAFGAGDPPELQVFIPCGQTRIVQLPHDDAEVSVRSASITCCDSHNRHCEPPGDLCCHSCSEAGHDTFPIRHADGSPCVMENR